MKKKSKVRNPIHVAMTLRHGGGNTTMRDRRGRRSRDSKKDWKKEEW